MDKNIIDEDTFLFIYQSVCRFFGVPYDPSDITSDDVDGEQANLIFMINKVCQEIVILTNRNQFPKDLKYLVIELVENGYSVVQNEINPATNQNINSMSEAGRSVSFGATQTWQTKYQMLLEQQLKATDNLISKYKLLYKVECPYAKN